MAAFAGRHGEAMMLADTGLRHHPNELRARRSETTKIGGDVDPESKERRRRVPEGAQDFESAAALRSGENHTTTRPGEPS